MERGDCEVENTFACKVLGGEVLKMTSYRDKSWGGETVKLRILLHEPGVSLRGPVGTPDFLLENECCIN